MIRAIVLFGSLVSALSLRKGQREGGFKIRTDSGKGVCAAHVAKRDLPIYFPLLCTGSVRDLKFHANARGHTSPRLRLSIGSIGKGYRTFPVFAATRTWTVSHGSLSAGVHILRYSGDRLAFNWLEVEGNGGSCTFENAPGFNSGSYTNTGLDVLSRVVGPNRNFSSFYKRQLHFAHETLGRNSDNSISSTVVANGVWEWLYQYSRQQEAKDEWLSRKLRDGKMYEESDIKPYLQVSLNQLPGRFGDDMVVCEPCNSLSNIAFHEASVYTTCKGLPFSQDEVATLMAGYSALAAGSAFFHASATKVGQLGDVFTMDLIMYQTHQLMVKKVLSVTGSALSSAERHSILTLDTSAGYAANKARDLTRLFKQPYTITNWKNGVSNLGLPGYMLSIITTVITFVESLNGNWPLPGLGSAVNSLIDALLGALGGREVDYVKGTFRPAIRKAFAGAKYCGDRSLMIGRFIKFTVTFVEAFMFQEEQIPVPPIVRDILGWLEKLGISSGALADMNTIWDLYNGETSMCQRRSPHATWHEKAAHGFMHIQNVASLLVTEVRRSC